MLGEGGGKWDPVNQGAKEVCKYCSLRKEGGFDRESVRGSGAVSWEVELEEDVVGGRCLCDGAE